MSEPSPVPPLPGPRRVHPAALALGPAAPATPPGRGAADTARLVTPRPGIPRLVVVLALGACQASSEGPTDAQAAATQVSDGARGDGRGSEPTAIDPRSSGEGSATAAPGEPSTAAGADRGEARAGGDAAAERPSTDLAAPSSRGAAEASDRLALVPVRAEQVCTTLGALRPSPAGEWLVEDPKLRATLAGSRGEAIGLEFRYLGATQLTERLRSGSERSQLGLELLARNTCNLVYVMWRLEPTAELVVSVKQNDGQSRHAECENRGYRRLRPTYSAALPRLEPDDVHRLEAQLTGGALTVRADGDRVWEGPLDAAALEFTGRGGLRSDNVRFAVLSLRADVASDADPCSTEVDGQR